ncbi:peptide-methionine (R)-S-oxide reductase MsrB [Arhodomonas sp. AD133]|uniref:peptide-methionine (R)-S-oxide reductase MsrB n=1 Tax=Arhodomonas sp. AD133 TaxID=3415009 RepID=UPI003EB8D5B7
MPITRRRLLLAGVAALAAPALLRQTLPTVRAAGGDGTFPLSLDERAWRERLTAEEYAILREAGTEPRGSSELLHEKRPGTYVCAGCGQPLFDSATKYDSGTGWPSFYAPIEGSIGTREDRSLFFMVRTEVHCSRCGGHLGHVFEDGPEPTGLRYCINGLALDFRPRAQA